MALGLPSVLVGSWTDEEAATGVTVVLPPPGTLGAIAVRGGAPGTREAAALSSTGAGVECHGVVLCGNSVFGLAAADGVVRWCAEQGRGLNIRDSIVPVIGGAVVYDIASPHSERPTAAAGWAACEAASADEPATGRVGVGRGCTIGKVAGRDFSVPGGLGAAVVRSGEVVVGAVVAVNALGDVIDADGTVLAGCTAPPGSERTPMTRSMPYPDSPGAVPRSRSHPSVAIPPSAVWSPMLASPSQRPAGWPTSRIQASPGPSSRRTRISTATRCSCSPPVKSTHSRTWWQLWGQPR